MEKFEKYLHAQVIGFNILLQQETLIKKLEHEMFSKVSIL